MRALASVLALALLAPITAFAQTTCSSGPTAAGAQCGNARSFSCCASGSYCQPWDANYYQCISVPSGCGAMETNVDYVGTDVASHFGLKQPSDCCDKCKENPQCEYFVYINTWGPACYLKKDKGAKKEMIGAAVGFKAVAPTPTTAAPSTGCPTLETNADYYGNDLYSKAAADVDACCALCAAESSCKVFTYATGTKTCYLKHTVGAKSTAANVLSGVKTSVTPTPTTLQPSTCPVVDKDTDYYGNDLKYVGGVTQEQCCAECRGEQACKAFTYVASWQGCYLKTSAGSKKSMPGAVSGVITQTPTPTTPTPTTPTPTTPAPTTPAPTTPAPTTPAPTTPAPTTPAPSTCPTLENDIDYYGNDLRTVENVDQTGCCSACDNADACVAFTYVPATRACYLKTGTGGRKSVAGVISGVKPSTCPVLEKDTDFAGNDLKYVGEVTQEGCCSACRRESLCQAFTYVAEWKGCYLKTAGGNRKAMPGAVSGVLTVTPTPTTPAPTTPTPTTPTPTTPSPQPVPATCAAVENGIDYSGNDLKSVATADLAACCNACNAEKLCMAFTYAYNTCYMKTAIGAKSILPGAVSGSKLSACANTEVGVDLYGGDLSSFTAADQSACCDACNANANCLAFTYVTASRACYLKKTGYERRTGSGLVSGIKKSGSTCVNVGGSCGGGATCCGANYCHPLSATNYVCLSAPDTCAAGLETDIDYYGFDVRTVTGVDNLADCCDACNNEPKCVVFTFSKQYNSCYLKSSAEGRTRVVGNVSGKRGPTPTPTTPPPTPNPMTPTPTTPMPPVGPWDVARCGQQKRNIFYHGNDIVGSEKAVDTVEECCDHCRATANCKAFTYFKRNAQKRCLLKTGTTLEKTNYADVLNAYVASGVMA